MIRVLENNCLKNRFSKKYLLNIITKMLQYNLPFLAAIDNPELTKFLRMEKKYYIF